MMSVSDAKQFPAPTVPEIAFLGRSNVGKSSVINSLLGSKLAKTSSTPGRTRSINFFEVRFAGKPYAEMIFSDLPGYGYAKLSREISGQWPSFIDPYLHQRASLALCLALIDLSVPPQASDKRLADFLGAALRPYIVVATKSDRLSGNRQRAALQMLSQENPQAEIIPYSSRSGDGRDALWTAINRAVSDFRSADASALSG